MKICYIGDGKSVHNHFMVDWFKNRGHEILFLTDDPDEGIRCETIQVVPRQGWGPLRHWKASRQVKKIVKKWKPDILHAHNVTGYGYWGGSAKFSPLVMTAWGSDLNILAKESAMIYRLVSRALKQADLITADAAVLCDTAREMAGPEADVRELQWGVDLSEFDRPLDEETRRRYRGDAEVVFISTRRLRPLYNINVILNAYQHVIPTLPKSRLLIVGDDEQRESLQNLTKKFKIQEWVDFTGWLPREDMAAALRSSDVFVSVPSSDSTALSLLEAFAARLPVIISDLPANHEWVASGDNGYLVRSGDVIKLTQAMIRTGENLDQSRQWGEANRALVEERGDREKEMRKLEKWYQELIQKKKDSQ